MTRKVKGTFRAQTEIGIVVLRDTTEGRTIELPAEFIEEKLGIKCATMKNSTRRKLNVYWGRENLVTGAIS